MDRDFLDVLDGMLREAEDRARDGQLSASQVLCGRALTALLDAPEYDAAAARARLAAVWMAMNDPINAVVALGPLVDRDGPSSRLKRQVLYEAAAALQDGARSPRAIPDAARRLMRVPDVGAAEIRLIHSEIAALFDAHDQAVIDHPDLSQPLNGPLYIVCMTPRSGSTFLARCLNEIGGFGRPGEYFHRNEDTAIPKLIQRFKSPTLDSYVWRVIYHSQTANGVCGIKTDLGSLVPLVIEGTFERLLPQARVIYLTREDVLMQAISLARAQLTGVWRQSQPESEPQYHFERIFNALRYLVTMTARWEVLFALHGITPLRITYEEIDNDVDAVIAKIAAFIGVPAAPTAFKERRETVQRDALNDAWRAQFLAEFGLA